MTSIYAKDTVVPVEKSRSEIEAIVTRYGASNYLSGWDTDAGTAFVGFRANNRFIRFNLVLPKIGDKEIATAVNRSGYRVTRTTIQAEQALQQELRRRWRSLALVIKAKLEAVQSKISDFETEFLGYIQLPDGTIFAEWAKQALAGVYDTGRMLPAPRAADEEAP